MNLYMTPKTDQENTDLAEFDDQLSENEERGRGMGYYLCIAVGVVAVIAACVLILVG